MSLSHDNSDSSLLQTHPATSLLRTQNYAHVLLWQKCSRGLLGEGRGGRDTEHVPSQQDGRQVGDLSLNLSSASC